MLAIALMTALAMWVEMELTFSSMVAITLLFWEGARLHLAHLAHLWLFIIAAEMVAKRGSHQEGVAVAAFMVEVAAVLAILMIILLAKIYLAAAVAADHLSLAT